MSSRQLIDLDLPPPENFCLAIKAWNLLGGDIDWSGLPIVCEILGVNDIELLIHQLNLIKSSVYE